MVRPAVASAHAGRGGVRSPGASVEVLLAKACQHAGCMVARIDAVHGSLRPLSSRRRCFQRSKQRVGGRRCRSFVTSKGRSAGRSTRSAICRSGSCAGSLRHAYHHTDALPRACSTSADCAPEDFDSSTIFSSCRCSIATPCAHARRAHRGAPPHWVIKKSTSGTTGQPVVVKYNAESRHWRDATRWRGYGWGGYQHRHARDALLGLRPADRPAGSSAARSSSIALLKRDLYVDCTPRGEEALLDCRRRRSATSNRR